MTSLSKNPTKAWRTRHYGLLRGVLAPLRFIFDELGEFLTRPTFPNGIEIGDGTPGTADPETGVVTRPPTTVVTSFTLTQPPQSVLDALDLLDQRAESLENDPIPFTRISDVEITTPMLAANAVAADKLAALYISVGKFIRSDDYDPGVEGWAIDGDGTVEFNNGTFRGSVVAGEINSSRVAFSEYPAGVAPPVNDPVDFESLLWRRPDGGAAAKLQKIENNALIIYSEDGIATQGFFYALDGAHVTGPGFSVGGSTDTYLFGNLDVGTVAEPRTTVMHGDSIVGGSLVVDDAAFIGEAADPAPLVVAGDILHSHGIFQTQGYTQSGASGFVAYKVWTLEGGVLGADGQVVAPIPVTYFNTAERRVMLIQAWEYESPTSVKPLGIVRASSGNIRFGTGVPGAKFRATVMYSEANMAAG